MTRTFDKLKERPRPGVDIGSLNYSERAQVRRIIVDGVKGNVNGQYVGNPKSIFYIEGDEPRAAERFTNINDDLIENLDFGKRNIIQSSVDREIYDWIRHYAGNIELEKFETVVVERQKGGTTWIFDRSVYDEHNSRRYDQNSSGRAVLSDLTLEELYDRQDESFTEADLRKEGAQRDVELILLYYDFAPTFDCHQTFVDGKPTMRKHK